MTTRADTEKAILDLAVKHEWVSAETVLPDADTLLFRRRANVYDKIYVYFVGDAIDQVIVHFRGRPERTVASTLTSIGKQMSK